MHHPIDFYIIKAAIDFFASSIYRHRKREKMVSIEFENTFESHRKRQQFSALSPSAFLRFFPYCPLVLGIALPICLADKRLIDPACQRTAFKVFWL